MIESLIGLFAGGWKYLVGALGVVAGVMTLFFQVKKAGKNEVIAETKTKEMENVQTANKVEHEVTASKPAARRRKLLDKWSRD